MALFDDLLADLSTMPITELQDLATTSHFKVEDQEIMGEIPSLTEDEMIDFIVDLPPRERDLFIAELRKEEAAFLRGEVTDEEEPQAPPSPS